MKKMGCDNCIKLDYIESTGTQYIDTEYVFKNKPKIVGKVKITADKDFDIMGTANSIPGCFIIDFSGTILHYRYSTTSRIYSNLEFDLGEWYDFEFSDKVKVNGIEKMSVDSYDFTNNEQTFLIGRGRSYGQAQFQEIKMYDGDTLVRDLIPCYKKDINKIGMYDKVENKFYINKGTGEFLSRINKPSLPTEDTELNYIETTGMQYIDTEYVFKNKPKIVGEIAIMHHSDKDIMGTPNLSLGCFIVDFTGSNLSYRYSTTSRISANLGISMNEWYNFEFSDKVKVNGIEKMSVDSYDFANNEQTFLIGRGRNYALARYKNIKMYDGDTLVRDLVPYYKKDVNQIGMYDKVENKFYINKGTGEFLYG